MSRSYELPDAILLQAQVDEAKVIIDKLEAENKKLREALEYIQNNTDSSYIFNLAEEALKKE